MPRIVIVTLGCSKNVVDSEHLGAAFKAAGWQVRYDTEPCRGDVLIINTCGFIGDAKEESINYILRAEELRKRGILICLVVFGCLVQRYKHELKFEVPAVDRWYGIGEEVQILKDLGIASPSQQRRFPSTPSHFAYLKIAEGCNRHCAFCAIPTIRGKFVSESSERLVQESLELARGGVKELILVAQELTYYGYDRSRASELVPLLQSLAAIDGIEWLRLHYAYPHDFPPDLITWLREEPKACHYLDIPVQHCSDSVLRSMKRSHDRAQTLELIKSLKQTIPDIALRTTLIVGYPTETEQEFEELLEFVQWAEFEHLGAFAYSCEEGTYAAMHLEDIVPEEEKQRRYNELMRLQRGIAERVRARRIGAVLPVIVEGKMQESLYIGRTPYDSPEIDGEILLHTQDTELSLGSIVNARVTGVVDYDLEGEYIAE
ncbi:MAG: 30S ribosomal protein S12 methylthiotransferase RimO [Bacteroides sp.]